MASVDLDPLPFISVIVPVYNVENYLAECLESIIRQTYSRLEIVCVNDGSTDNSLNILNSYASKDSRLKIITQVNGGLSAARNTGLKYSSGEFILFVDSDDLLEENAIERILSYFNSPDIDFVAFGYKTFSTTSSSVTTRTSIYNNSRTFFSPGSWIIYLPVTAWSKMYRASFLKKNNLLFPLNLLNEDTSFHWNCISYASKIIIASDIVYIYRIRTTSIMSKIKQKHKGLALHFLYNLDIIHDCWSQNKFIETNIELFQYLFEVHTRLSFQNLHRDDTEEFYSIIRSYSRKWGIYPRKYTLAYDLINSKQICKFKYKLFNSLRKKFYKLTLFYNPQKTFFPSA